VLVATHSVAVDLTLTSASLQPSGANSTTHLFLFARSIAIAMSDASRESIAEAMSTAL